MIRILLVDDQQLFRLMLEEVLKVDPEIEIIGTAADGLEAVQMTLQYHPDIVLMDIQMPFKTGVEALVEIKEKAHKTKVVMLTTFEDTENIMAAYLAGTDGYLVKDLKPEMLIMAVKCIYNNLSIMHQSVHQYLKQSQKNQQLRISDDKHRIGDMVFTNSDIEIIKMIAEGLTNREIAANLNYSEGTIKNKVSNILSVMNLPDRTQIAIQAIKKSII